MNPKCFACDHTLLECHYAGPCECGCPEMDTAYPVGALWETVAAMRLLYHTERGTALGSQAKKAYYTAIDLYADRTRQMAETAIREGRPLQGL